VRLGVGLTDRYSAAGAGVDSALQHRRNVPQELGGTESGDDEAEFAGGYAEFLDEDRPACNARPVSHRDGGVVEGGRVGHMTGMMTCAKGEREEFSRRKFIASQARRI
jgi:hypothetical protein